MVAPVPVESSPPSELQRLPLPDPLPDGSEPEVRVVVSGISWKNYLEFDRQLGDDCPGLNVPLLERCVAIRPWPEARKTFRAGLAQK